jgi:hypothetical protein
MAKRQQPDGFDLLLADHQNSSHYFEEADGSHRLWSELSAEGKLAYLAGDAALYNVPFERFRAAVRDVLGEVGPAIREDAALRLALRSEKELHAVARLLPPDERLEGTPLPERVEEALAEARPGPSRMEERPVAERSLLQQLASLLRERKVRLADYVIYDTSEAVLGGLEAFGDEFERLARTPEQQQLAAAFQQFVGEFTGTGSRDAYQKMLAEAAAPEKSKDKDNSIER